MKKLLCILQSMVIVTLLLGNNIIWSDAKEDTLISSQSRNIMLEQAFETRSVTAQETGSVRTTIVGTPVADMREGMYDSVYWSTHISGSGPTCWIEIDCAQAVDRLETSLTIVRSDGYWYPVDEITLNSLARNSTTTYTRWDDGLDYCALSCSGTSSINSTQVSSMSVSGWC